jgi:hypothetical protein
MYDDAFIDPRFSATWTLCLPKVLISQKQWTVFEKSKPRFVGK